VPPRPAVSFRNGTLFVEVDSASWMNELSYLGGGRWTT